MKAEGASSKSEECSPAPIKASHFISRNRSDSDTLRGVCKMAEIAFSSGAVTYVRTSRCRYCAACFGYGGGGYTDSIA